MKLADEERTRCTECGEQCDKQVEFEEGYGYVMVCLNCLRRAVSLLESTEEQTGSRTGS